MLTTLLAVSLGHAADTGHCAADETTLFSCTVKGDKALSICQVGGLVDLGVTGGLQYRFGPKGSPELRFPEDVSDYSVWHYAEQAMATAMSESLWFDNGGYRYTVTVMESGGPNSFVGVVVSKGDDTVATLPCVSEATHSFADIPALIKGS